MGSVKDLQYYGLLTSLYPWEETTAIEIAKGRTEQNLNRGNRHSYDASKLMADNEAANLHSVVAEIGASRIIGAYCFNAIWNRADHDTYKELPDALRGKLEIEFKWRRSSNKMPVDRKDMQRNRLVLWVESRVLNCECILCCDTPRTASKIRLLGGDYAKNIWDKGEPYNNDPNRVDVDAKFLTPIKRIF